MSGLFSCEFGHLNKILIFVFSIKKPGLTEKSPADIIAFVEKHQQSENDRLALAKHLLLHIESYPPVPHKHSLSRIFTDA